jgi:hypothetical protein
MAKAASAIFGGSQIGTRPIISRFNHDGKSARGYSFTPVTRGGDGKIVTGEALPVPYGSAAIVDIGSMLWGPHCYRPYNDRYLVPYGQSIPMVPEDAQGEFTDHLAIPLYLKDRGLARWLVGGVLAQNAWHVVLTRCWSAAEAAQGLIPVIVIRPSLPVPIASRNGEISYQPVLEITGWAQRDPMFGERTVPAPLARVASEVPAAPVVLAQPTPVILPPERTAQAAPAKDPFASVVPAATPTSAQPVAVAPALLVTTTIAAPRAAPRF